MTGKHSLDDNAIIVTGATREPGRAIVAALATAGANIAAVDDGQESLQALAVEVAGRGAPGRVLAMAADLRQLGMCRRVVSRATMAFTEIGGLVIDTFGTDTIPSTGAQGAPFWDYAADPSAPHEVADIALALAAPAVRQFRARGRGRLVFTATAQVDAAMRLRIAGWAAELTDSGVTANLLLTGTADSSSVAGAVRWLMSETSDGFNGRSLSAAQWDSALPCAEAADRASTPIA